MAARGDEPTDDSKFVHPETALGGADSVEKTSYGSPHGAEPGGATSHAERHGAPNVRKGEGSAVAGVSPGGGSNVFLWVAVALGVLAMVAYLAGVFG